MAELLIAIAALCGASVPNSNFDENKVLKCQQYYVTCARLDEGYFNIIELNNRIPSCIKKRVVK